MNSENLKSLKLSELKNLAKENKITGVSTLKKNEIIDILEKHFNKKEITTPKKEKEENKTDEQKNDNPAVEEKRE